MVYKHYEIRDYTERTVRAYKPCRVQFALEDAGVYTNIEIDPTPVGYPTGGRPMLCDRLYSLPVGAVEYYNPYGLRIGWEFIANDDTIYTVNYTYNGEPHSLVIPALPVASPAQYVVEERDPYTIGGLAGILMRGYLTGTYNSGGVPLGLTVRDAKVVNAIIPSRYFLYQQNGGWYLQLFDESGQEYKTGTVIAGKPVILDVRGFIR